MPAIHMKNPEKVASLVSSIAATKPNKVAFLADFDSTISHPLAANSWAVVAGYSGFTPAYKKANEALFLKYHPIEIDTVHYTQEQRIAAMEEWWEAAHATFVQQDITRARVRAAVEETLAGHTEVPPLRAGTQDMCNLLAQANIPLLVFSAGIGDVVVEMMHAAGLHASHVHYCSNFMTYPEPKEGESRDDVVATGWQADLIHVFNKHIQHVAPDHDFHGDMAGRDVAIVVGDSLGDVGMSEGLDLKHVIKVGFLNKNVEERLELFKEAFDVVLVQDYSFDWINDNLLKPMIANSPEDAPPIDETAIPAVI